MLPVALPLTRGCTMWLRTLVEAVTPLTPPLGKLNLLSA